MPITERTLRKWRKEALLLDKVSRELPDEVNLVGKVMSIALCERILRMSSELLDQHLMRKL